MKQLRHFYVLNTFVFVLAAHAGGGNSQSNSNATDDRCQKAKISRHEICYGNAVNIQKCEEKKLKEKMDCHEKAKENQAAAEASKKDDHSAKDSAALAAIDDQITKLVLIRDQAMSMKAQLQAILTQLSADSTNACLKVSEFESKKVEAKEAVHDLRKRANEKVAPSKMDEASITALLKKVNDQVPDISSKNSAAAMGKKDVATGYANEAKTFIRDYEAIIGNINSTERSVSGTCSKVGSVR